MSPKKGSTFSYRYLGRAGQEGMLEENKSRICLLQLHMLFFFSITHLHVIPDNWTPPSNLPTRKQPASCSTGRQRTNASLSRGDRNRLRCPGQGVLSAGKVRDKGSGDWLWEVLESTSCPQGGIVLFAPDPRSPQSPLQTPGSQRVENSNAVRAEQVAWMELG